jgi:hypothetical protein
VLSSAKGQTISEQPGIRLEFSIFLAKLWGVRGAPGFSTALTLELLGRLFKVIQRRENRGLPVERDIARRQSIR